MSTTNIEFKCTRCGSKTFQIPDSPKADDVVTCNGCGGTAKYGDLKASAIKQSTEFVNKSIRDMLKKAGFK